MPYLFESISISNFFHSNFSEEIEKFSTQFRVPVQASTVANLKAGICDVLSAYTSSQNPLWEALGANVYQTFCFTELSLMESFFREFRSRISKLQEDPQYQVTFVRETVSFLSLLSELQNETSVWRLLLLAPDITQGVLHVQEMVAALRDTSRTFIDPETDFLSDASDSGLQALQDLITRLNCTEQDGNNSETTDLCELTHHWNGSRTLLAQMKEIVSKIISPDFASADFQMGNLTKDVETIQKSLLLFKDLQEGNSTTELKNLKLSNQSDNQIVLRLTEILSRQMRDEQHKERRELFRKEDVFEGHDFTSLLRQTGFSTSSFFQIMSHLTEIQSIYDLTRNIWDLVFLNKTDFKATKLWRIMKMITSQKFLYVPEKVRRYLTALQEVPSLFANSLLKPTTMENFPEKILALQKIFDIVANVNASHNYLLISSLTDLMQQIQNSINAYQWNEFNTYWHIVEKLRSAKWNDTDIIAYGQVLDILHKNLYIHRNSSGLLFNKVLEQLTEFVNHLLEDYSGGALGGGNISVVLDTIVKTLHVLEDLEEKYISALITTNPLMHADAHNETTQRLFEIFREGVDILSDPRLLEASYIKKMDNLFSFSHLLDLQDFHSTPGRHNASAEGNVLELWSLTLSPFVREDIQDNERLLNCTVKELHRIAIEVLFSNTTLNEAMAGSACCFLFTSMKMENRTAISNQTFMEVFQLMLQNLKSMPSFSAFQKRKYLTDEFQCFVKSLEVSSGFLSKLDAFINYKNPWIQKIHKSLTSISGKLSQSNLSCQIPLFDNMAAINESSAFHILIPFVMNDTETYSHHLSVRAFNQSLLGQEASSGAKIMDILHLSLSPFLDFHSQNFTDWLVDRNHLLMFYKLLQDKAEQYPALNDALEMAEDIPSPSAVDNFSRVWNLVSKRSLTEMEGAKHGLKLMERVLVRNESNPLLEASIYILKKVMLLDKLKNLKTAQDPNFHANKPNMEYVLEHFAKIMEMLFNENLLQNEEGKASSPNNLIAQFLFSEFENVFVKMLPNNGFRSYVLCLMNMTDGLDSELSEEAAEKIPFARRDTSKNYSSVPEILMFTNLTSALCDSERLRAAQQACQLPDASFEDLCRQSQFHRKLLHGVALSDHLATSLINHGHMPGELREILIGDPTKLRQEIKWFRENVPQFHYIQDIPGYLASVDSVVNHTKTAAHSKKQDTIIDLFRNVDRLKEDLRNVLLFEMLQLESCQNGSADAKLEIVAEEFCHLPLTERVHKSYVLGITLLRYLDVYNFLYKVLFPKELQSSLDKVFGLLHELDHFKNRVESDMRPLLDVIHSLKKLRQSRNAPLSKALFKASNLTMDAGTFKTISKSLCNQEITPLFFESLLPDFEEQNVHHSSAQDEGVKHIMKKYGIPQDSTPFCLSFYLDLVRTPTGALIWSFLKPMLLGKILFTPDTPETRAIMGKNTLQNPFVQVFIKIMVKLDAIDLLNQINQLDDIRLELQSNADIINQLDTLSGLAVNVSSCVLFDRIKPVRSEDELETLAKQLFLKNELFASIIFRLPADNKERGGAGRRSLSLPPLVNYTIRMSSKISQTTKRIREKIWTVGPHNSASQSQIYSRAFVYVQDSLERAIIELQTGKRLEDIAVQVQGTPYPCYSKDMFLTSVTYSLPFTLMAAWVLFIAAFVKKLVQEKDLRLYEYMKMMGVNSSSHFFAWFLECASFLLITVSFLILILKVGNILPQSNVVILFLYLTDYSFSIIAMCYLISVFFNNTNIAALVGSLVYILTFFPFIVLLVVENHVSFSVKSLLSLLSPTAFSYASQYIARYEEQGVGLQWHNVYQSPMTGDNTNFAWMCWLILIDSFIYFILGWYIRNVFPGKYGMAAPWYFPLLPSYWAERYGYIPLWNGKSKGLHLTSFFWRKEPAFPEKMYVQSALPSNLEPEPCNLTVGVSLHGITKIYGSKAGVQNLNLKFYEGNITSLLGHNGAGKTTTISILTGLFPASSGTIFVYGKDIRTDQDVIRKNMGICMQHNVLFSYLTTEEHLRLYGSIKVPHWSKPELQEEVERTLKETGLYSHRHKLAGSLSGGMKRKLSISIALLGGSKVVILDEPTTGVDPCSRRGIWEIISKNRKGRTIILSTHHLDEAEVLSDRIAFLENGGLKCCGSPFFLKETFGSGYHLTLTKKKSPAFNLAEECDTPAVTAMIQSHLPAAYLKEDIGGELVYVLPPFNSSVSAAYQSLLKSLDHGASDLHIGCYGISDSTVEEVSALMLDHWHRWRNPVFLNLTKDLSKSEPADAELPQEVPGCPLENDEMSVNSDSLTERDDQALVKSKKQNGLLLRKAAALFVKRFHHTRRNVKGFIAQVILPVLFVTAAMGLGTLRTEVAEYPALHLSPSLYGDAGQADFFG
ncbi:UNVERIFIED_CONTAM: hypothetical protein K2H54_054465 [Gekko kuhli]